MKEVYLVTVRKERGEEEGYSVVNPFWDTTAVCHTVKKSYQIGIWMAGLEEPSHTYRKTADIIREQGVVFIHEKSEPDEVRLVIAKVKKY